MTAWTWIIETDREADGRWIAEVIKTSGCSGCIVYGATEEEAVAAAVKLARSVLKTPAEASVTVALEPPDRSPLPFRKVYRFDVGQQVASPSTKPAWRDMVRVNISRREGIEVMRTLLNQMTREDEPIGVTLFGELVAVQGRE